MTVTNVVAAILKFPCAMCDCTVKSDIDMSDVSLIPGILQVWTLAVSPGMVAEEVHYSVNQHQISKA